MREERLKTAFGGRRKQAELDVLSWEVPADAEYGALRTQLESAGSLIGGNDLLIAAHALAVNATLVTANVAEFSRVE